jgi:DNA-binding winged helix-turn-helix (wHTH) protein/TolB-like protein
VAANLRRFGVFAFDLDTLELSRNGRPLRLQPQPARVLAALLAHAGRVVTREELRAAVWRDDTFVDFDRGLNFCVAQIRAALGDDADMPRFIRTLPKRGYEFICPVEAIGGAEAVARPVATPAEPPVPVRRRWARAGWIAAATLVVASGVTTMLLIRHPALPVVAVARFDNETGNATLTRFSDELTDGVVEQLTASGAGHFGVVGNAAILRVTRDARDLVAIGRALGASYVILGQVQSDTGGRLRVLAHLIRLPDQTHVSVSRTDGLTDASLPSVDGLASKIAETFTRRLGEGARGTLSAAPPSH